MKRIALLIVLSLGASLMARAQWWEAYSEKTGLVLTLHQTDTAFELYSPLQTSDPIPVSKWSLLSDTLRLECASIGFKATLIRNTTSLPPSRGDVSGTSSESGNEEANSHSSPLEGGQGGAITWSGIWRQGLLRESVTFRPADTLFQLRRPQTPQPPYRFDEETVTAEYIDSHGDSVHLEGTLSYPKGSGRFPTIVLVSGSGQQNRDEELFQHKPFLVLADYLASRGIAVLRYDDRGMGASTGPVDPADTYLFSEDAEAMFNALKDNPHVDPARLGIGGHSEGGAIAPMVAARNKDVKFVLMLAGQGCTGLDVLLQQNDALYRATGLSDSLLTLRNACMRELFALPAGTPQKDYQAIINRHTAGLSKAQIDSLGLGRGAAYTLHQQLSTPWMQAFLHLDPADYLPKVTCPILALNGNKDLQVLPHPNLDHIKALCPKADCRELSGLNHLFQHCEKGLPSEYMMIEETFSEEAMKAIADWILSLP